MSGFPTTPQARKAGMAALRATMLAAHQRELARAKTPQDVAVQQKMIDAIRAAQTKFGDV